MLCGGALLGAAAAADSNPALLADGFEAVLPGGELAGDDSDTVGDLSARLEVHPFYGAGRAGRTSGGGVSLGLAVEGRRSLHADLGSLDRTSVAGVAQLAWGGDPAGYLTGPLGHTRVPLGNRRAALLLQAGAREDRIDGESYRSAVDLAAALTLRPVNRTATRLDLHYRDGDFDGVDSPDADLIPDRSGETLVVGVSQYLYLGRRDRYLRAGLAVGERDSDGDLDAELASLEAAAAFPLGGGFHLLLEAAAEREEFDELTSNPLFPSFLADRPREDETLRARASLAWSATRSLFVVARAGWAERDSDLGAAGTLVDLGFERSSVSLGLLWFVDGGGGR